MILEDFGNCSKETYTKEDDRKTQVDYLYKKKHETHFWCSVHTDPF